MSSDIFNGKERLGGFLRDTVNGLQFIWKSGRRLTLVNATLFVVGAIVPLLSLLALRKLIDQGIRSGISWQQSGMLLIIFAGLQFAGVLISEFSDYKLAEQQQIITDQVAARVLHKAIELDLQYYENPAFYDELHMAQQQSLSKPAALVTAMQGIIHNLVTIIIFTGFMFIAHWSILLLIVALSVPLAVSKVLHGYRQFQLEKHCLPAQRKAADLFRYLTTDTFAKEVRLFSFGKNFISQFSDFRRYVFAKKKELHRNFIRQNIIIQLFEIIIVTIIYCIILGAAIAGRLTVGGLVMYFQVFQRLQSSIASLFQSGINLFQNQLYLREILKYLYAPSLIRNTGNFLPPPAFSNGITVAGLSFTYPQTERQVLRDVNMTFAPGKITAIVGENGSGKTTLIKLLCRLYEVDTNTIFMDGMDISRIDPEIIRKNITVLFQDFGKYYLTVEDNITLGHDHDDKERLQAAARRAGIADKINTMPAGYKTHLGRTYKRGEQLSGGQWQKIALARGFFKDSNILILDEPTSSMDPIAEHEFFLHLKSQMGNKLVILITHRLYNLKLADHVYVMEDGHVAEHGAFEELLAARGAFANMYDKQTI